MALLWEGNLNDSPFTLKMRFVYSTNSLVFPLATSELQTQFSCLKRLDGTSPSYQACHQESVTELSWSVC